MYAHSRRVAATASALFMILLLPTAARTQARLAPITVTAKLSGADAMDAEAAKYEISNWGKLVQAARLREKAAALRNDADLKRAASLYWAGRDHYYLHHPRTARALMIRSAEHALALGDVIAAARAFTDAAYISIELRDVESARFHARRAQLLSNSPMLTQAQRQGVLARLPRVGTVTEAVAILDTPR